MKNSIFKCFGITKSEIKTILSDIFANSEGVLITLCEKGPEVTIKIEGNENNSHILEKTAEIFKRLNNYIYAEEDISIYEAAFQLLKLNNLTLATAESITAGNVAASLVKYNSGASKILLEGNVVYTNEAKMRMLDVPEKVLNTHTDVSAQTTYEMAKGCLLKSGANIVIATTGYAGGDDNSQNGLNYIAIGDSKKIDVYKNRFEGTRAEVIELTTIAAFFYLIKKLRKNDFFLEKNVI